MTAGGRPRWHVRRRVLLGLVAGVATVAVAGLILAPDLVGRAIVAALAARGVVVDRLDVEDLSPGGLRIEDIVLTGGPLTGRIDAVDISFDPIALLGTGRLRRVAVRGAELAATLDPDGLPAPGGTGGGVLLPADEIAVDDLRLRLASPWLDAVVDVEGVAAQRADGRLAADLDIAGAASGGAGWAAGPVEGWISVIADPGRPPVLRGQLTAAEGDARSVPFTDAVIQIGSDDGAYWALMRTAVGGGGAVRVDIAVEDGSIRAEADLAADDLAGLSAALALDPGLSGAADLDLAADVPLETIAALPDTLPDLDGTLRIRLQQVAVGDRLRDLSGTIEGDLVARNGSVTLTGARPWMLAADVERLGRASLSLSQAGDRGPQVVFDPAAQAGLRFVGDYAASLGPVGGSGAVAASAALRSGRIAVDRLTLQVPTARLGDIEGEIRSLSVAGAGTWSSFSGRLSLVAGASGDLPGGVRVDGGTIETAGAVVGGDGVLRFVPDACVAVGAASLDLGGALSLPDGIQLCAAAPAKRPLASVTVAAGLEAAAAFTTAPTEIVLALRGESAAATFPALDAGLRYTSGTGLAVDLRAAGGRVALASPAVVLDGIGVNVEARIGASTEASADWRIETAMPAGNPAPVVPLRVVGTATAAADGVAFKGTAIGGRGGLMLAFEGGHADPGGAVEVRLDPVTFAPGVRQPADLFPAAAALKLGAVAGAVSGRLRYGWGGRTGSGATIVVDDLSLVAGGAAVTGISGRLEASSVAPFVLPAGQRLSIGLLDVGIPLRNGAATFGLDADGRLSVRELGFDWAGGRLGAEPFLLSLDEPQHAVVLRATGIDLAQAIAAAPVDDLEVTGRLNGRVPLRLRNDTITVDDAVLRTTEPGVIRYTPAGRRPEGDDNVGLLMDALSNFHYDSLTVRLDGSTGQDMAARVEIRGANPDLYDGYPVALNVNVSGALDRILRQGIAAAGYAGSIGEAMRGRLDGGLDDDFLDSIQGIQQ